MKNWMALALLSAPLPLIASDFYGGISVGQTSSEELCQSADKLNAIYASNDVSAGGGCDDDRGSYKLNFGYQMHDYVAIDLSYLPTVKVNGRAIGHEVTNTSTWDSDTKLHSELSSWVLAAVGSLPLSDSWLLTAQVGYNGWRSESQYYSRTEIVNLGLPSVIENSVHKKDKGGSLSIGAGVRWLLQAQLVLRLEWERLTDISLAHFDNNLSFIESESDIDRVSLGINFLF